jgi:aldose sugar dehydrogenase
MRLMVVFTAIATVVASAAADLAQARVLDTQAGQVRVDIVAGGLEHPWGLEFLPDRRMLVTERPGRLRIVSGNGRISQPLVGIPRVFAQGQGGLLDVALDPLFPSNRRIYICYAEPGEGGRASTAVARGRLGEGRLEGVRIIFRQLPKVDGPSHFGCRLAFSRDSKLFVTLGERFKFRPAQDLSSHLGKIVRINPDGSVPRDNPFVGRAGTRPEIWSYGHRNVQGAAFHPQTGVLWTSEFGPRGGDEINLPRPGRNYGWPLVSWGQHYDGRDIPDPPTRPALAQSIHHWNPAISPSGIAFYTGNAFPAWRGNLLIGGLSSESLLRLGLQGQRVTHEERIRMGLRIRDVRQGPDGAVYLLTDESAGEILRLTPAGNW